MAFCSNCGEQINDGAKFCAKCGSQVGNYTKDDNTSKKEPTGFFDAIKQGWNEDSKSNSTQESTNKMGCWQKFGVGITILWAIGFVGNQCEGNESETKAPQVKEQVEKQTPQKSQKDEIRELGYHDGVIVGREDGGDMLRESIRSGITLDNALAQIPTIAKVFYKEEHGNDISNELLDEYAKQFLEGYKSVVLKK